MTAEPSGATVGIFFLATCHGMPPAAISSMKPATKATLNQLTQMCEAE